MNTEPERFIVVTKGNAPFEYKGPRDLYFEQRQEDIFLAFPLSNALPEESWKCQDVLYVDGDKCDYWQVGKNPDGVMCRKRVGPTTVVFD